MSEYIVEEPNEHGASWRVHERIVRCRDCRSYRASDATCHAWQWSNWDEAVEVDPDGFCSWGKRKVGDA